MKRIITSAVPLLVLLVSCDMEIDVNYVETELKSKLVLNSICCSDTDEHTVSLGISHPLFGESSLADTLASPAVSVYHNGKSVPVSLEHVDANGAEYKFKAPFVAGDKVEMNASASGLGSIYGEALFPSGASIDKLVTSWYKEGGVEKLKILADISDIRGQQDYYRVVVKTKTVFVPNDPEDDPWNTKEIDISNDPIFSDYSGPIPQQSANYYRIFSDRLFADGSYTLNLSVDLERASSWIGMSVVVYLRVELHTLQEPFYKYLYSTSAAHNKDFYSEPVAVYSNINNGFGILGTYSVFCKEIQLED